jgi:hypothetical protein
VSEREIKAELLPMSDDADASEALLHDREGINRRAHLLKVIYWTDGERMPIDVFSYIREASRCFEVGCFLGTIALASCAVETILNNDIRTHRRKWIYLDPQVLQTAHTKGLPVQNLLSPDESIDAKRPSIFVKRRNETNHGNVSSLIRHFQITILLLKKPLSTNYKKHLDLFASGSTHHLMFSRNE